MRLAQGLLEGEGNVDYLEQAGNCISKGNRLVWPSATKLHHMFLAKGDAIRVLKPERDDEEGNPDQGELFILFFFCTR